MVQIIPIGLEDSPALRYFISKGWNWTGGEGGQVQLETCPFCKKGDYKCYVAVMSPKEGTRDGLFQCFHGSCQKAGNLRTMKEALGDIIPGVESRNDWAGKNSNKTDQLPDVEACHAALLNDAEALDYLLVVRGFTLEVIKRQKLGLKEKVYFREAGEVRALVIPYLVNGNQVFCKYRTLPPNPKDFICPNGYETPLYNGEILKAGLDEIIFVEGEADCLSCLSNGILNVVGVPGAGIKKAIWIETLDAIAPKNIYILFDNDKEGKKGAQGLASRIGIDKCLRLVLPQFKVEVDGVKRLGKDVGEWFTQGGGTPEKFEELKRQAKLFDVTGVTSCEDALTQLEDELAGKSDLSPRYVSQWPSLNRLVGFEDGDVVDILAPEKIGKTTLGLNLLDHMVSTYDEDGLIVCLEMTQARLVRKWVSKITGFEDAITIPGTPEAKKKLEELKTACTMARGIQQKRNADLYFAYPQLVKHPEDVYMLIRDCIRRYGVKWIMLDNVQLLCDTTLENKGYRTVHLSQISKNLAKIAKDYRVKLVRILQPRQIEAGEIVQSRHVDGSSQINKDCDCQITAWRRSLSIVKKSEYEDPLGESEGEGSFESRMRLTVGLSRYSSGGFCDLEFDGARSQVREREKLKILKPQYSQSIKQEASDAGVVPVIEEGEI